MEPLGGLGEYGKGIMILLTALSFLWLDFAFSHPQSPNFQNAPHPVPGHLTPKKFEEALDLGIQERSYFVPPRDFSGYSIGLGACSLAELPLQVVLSDYTVETDGSTTEGGWTPDEAQILTHFMCRMFPILVELYGLPFENYTLHYVRDRRYASTNIFIPLTSSIHSAPFDPITLQGFYPQLITHELLHAFRGQRILSADPTTPYNYHPRNSGFEEGFAQAVSYDAMMEYAQTYPDDPYVNPIYQRSITEWYYDFYNQDDSMQAEGFFSEGSGTLVPFMRYSQAAAAIKKLALAIPDFYLRFNLLYYNGVRNQIAAGNPLYVPNREDIIRTIQALSPWISGKPTRAWVEDQRILRCQRQPGKKIWMYRSMYNHQSPIYTRIHFVETFPNASEWAYYFQTGYVYYRLHNTPGNVQLAPDWAANWTQNYPLLMKPYLFWEGIPRACDLTCAVGISVEQMRIFHGQLGTGGIVEEPVDFLEPGAPGLYRLDFSFTNPHFSPAPEFELEYDSEQELVKTRRYLIMGLSEAQYADSEIFGGIAVRGRTPTGSVIINHSNAPGTMEAVISNGIFHGSVPAAWLDTRLGATVLRDGKLSFDFDFGNRMLLEPHRERMVTGGHYGGKHYFFFDFESPRPVDRIPRPTPMPHP